MTTSIDEDPIPGRRAQDAGGVSPVLILVLLAIVALFVFALVAGARGGLSSAGCLPDSAEGRRELLDRWFAPALATADELKLSGCTMAAGLLTVHANGTCRIELPGLPPPARSWREKIRGAFQSGRRRLFLSPLSPPVHLTVVRAPRTDGASPSTVDTADTIDADLEKRTDVVFSSDGVRAVVLRCRTPGCKVDLSPPPTQGRADERDR